MDSATLDVVGRIVELEQQVLEATISMKHQQRTTGGCYAAFRCVLKSLVHRYLRRAISSWMAMWLQSVQRATSQLHATEVQLLEDQLQGLEVELQVERKLSGVSQRAARLAAKVDPSAELLPFGSPEKKPAVTVQVGRLRRLVYPSAEPPPVEQLPTADTSSNGFGRVVVPRWRFGTTKSEVRKKRNSIDRKSVV